MTSRRPIVFVSNMNGSPWGGSEELWSRAASALAREGVPVKASVYAWSPMHSKVAQLLADGVKI